MVLGRSGKPLMPCTVSRAKEFLKKGRARVHKLYPFTIRLVDRECGDTQLITIKIDPGATTTGLALNRQDSKDKTKQTVLHLAEITHRGSKIHKQMQQRRAYRGRRRSANLRYRAPRFNNRTRREGWLPPSIQSRLDNILFWFNRYKALIPILSIEIERVRFDTQLLQNPEITGVEYQQGTLAGYEVREYLLEKWGHKCAYCNNEHVPLQIEHIIARGRRGSDRISNLTLACEGCNLAKNNRPVTEFLSDKPEKLAALLAQAQTPLAGAAALNAARNALYFEFKKSGMPVEGWTGGHTKFNRQTLRIPKSHALDAACVGEVRTLSNWQGQVLAIKASGRGAYQRTRVNKHGTARGYLPREKAVKGFRTGDLVRATVPDGKNAGTHTGRVAVRTRGSFNIQTKTGTITDISWKHCRRVMPGDGYAYTLNKRDGDPSAT
jgi:5-methylcytosine-specific restriction endonuclease McrA